MPSYIDCNPRLVEPMSTLLAGIDLMDGLFRVSRGEDVSEQPSGRAGVRSHLAMQILLGLGFRGATRRDIARKVWRAAAGRGPYANCQEELTPVSLDRASLVPLLGTAAALAIFPACAHGPASRGGGAQLLTFEAMQKIRTWGPERDAGT